jgi:predicted CXXCH cytochrome family protein
VLDDRACLNCHLPHGGGREGLLPEDVAAACLICHKDPIKGPGDKVRVAGVPELAVKAYFPHGPVHDGDCAACHTLHGGELANLLTVPYAEPFYQKFSEEAYALCFSCHDAKLARTETTENGTGFRDGTRNLHFVHVAKEATGRSCRACHTVHASRTPAQIAESVPFGQWSIPLNFAQTATGGSCAPGCHRAVAYDREQAVGDSITAPPSATGAEPNPGPSGTPPPR